MDETFVGVAFVAGDDEVRVVIVFVVLEKLCRAYPKGWPPT
jgi:hypothetical protein